MAKAVVVFARDIPDQDAGEMLRDLVERGKQVFGEDAEVQIYGAIRGDAEKVLEIFRPSFPPDVEGADAG